MDLFPKDILNKLIANGRANKARMKAGEDTIDHVPVVKLFTPDAGATWLLTEIAPDLPDFAFGLCDLGLGYPELGSVSMSEIKALRGKLGLPVERDLHFTAKAQISVYADEARIAGGIIA